jgi:hypothetical protein
MKDIHSQCLGKMHSIVCIYNFMVGVIIFPLKLCIYIAGNNGGFWTITAAALGGTYVSTLVFIEFL